MTASDAASGDLFGFSVAVSGSIAVVGASNHDSQTGAAYVFAQSGSTWTQQQEFTASDVAVGDNFGYSVGVSGSTVVVGAPNNNSNTGAAYAWLLPGPPGPLSAQFIVPSVMSTATSPTEPYSLFWTTGTCPSGSVYTLRETVDSGVAVTVFSGAALATKVNLLPGDQYTFSVDCGGPMASMTFRLTGFQEGSASYTGTWTTTSFAGAWGGTARYSSAAGASATFTCQCEAFAWVSDEGSSHGWANVYVDGVLRKTVNTQTSANKNRVVVFKYGWTTDGFHTMKIVNLATGGHPRVNVDGFLTRTSS